MHRCLRCREFCSKNVNYSIVRNRLLIRGDLLIFKGFTRHTLKTINFLLSVMKYNN